MILCTRALATHNRAGEILYKRIVPFTSANGTPVYTYSITLITYTDHGPNIADRCADTLYFGDGTKAIVPRSNSSTLTCQGCTNCGELISTDPSYLVKKNIYTCVHTYPTQAPATYTVYTIDSYRNTGVHNIPNSDQEAFSIESVIFTNPILAFNSSPVLTKLPIDRAIVNQCFYHNVSAYDADGDSLSYEIVPCMSGPNQSVPGYFFPETGVNGSFAIDSITGLLSWCVPQLSDQYNIAIRVKEWRQLYCNSPYYLIGSVERDMQVIVDASPPITFSTSSAFPDACVAAGTNFSKTFSMTATSSYSASPAVSFSVSLQGAAANIINLPVATLSNTSGTSSLSTTLSWQTNCKQAQRQPYEIELLYLSSNGLAQFYKQFSLKILPSQPTIYNVVSDTSIVTLYWDKLNACLPNLRGYYIYRKVGPNSWTHGPCENGVPLSSGFQLLDYRPATDSSYSDANLWLVPTGSTVNYIVTTSLDDCTESFADHVETLSVIVGIKNESLAYAVAQVFPNPFSDFLNVVLNENYNGKAESSIYSVDGSLVFKTSSLAEQGKFGLELNNFKPGVYTLQIKTSQGIFYRKLIRD